MSTISNTDTVSQDNAERYEPMVQRIMLDCDNARQDILRNIRWGWSVSTQDVKKYNELRKMLDDAGHKLDDWNE